MAVELNYTSMGDGEPLVISHGLFGSARNWNTVARRLAERYRVLMVDVRNHGHSPWSEQMSYQDLADDLDAFLERHDIRNAGLIGHSMGGKATMVWALKHSERRNPLMIVDMAPVAYDHSFMPFVNAMQQIDMATLESRTQADRRLAERVPDAGIRMFLLQNLVYHEGKFSWRVNLPVLESRMRELTGFPAELATGPGYPGKTLFLHGSASGYVQPEHEALIHRLFPAATMKVIDGAGHWVHADQPATLVDAIMTFLTSTDTDT